MKALQLFRLIGVLALLALYNTTALAAMPDAKLEEASAKKCATVQGVLYGVFDSAILASYHLRSTILWKQVAHFLFATP